MSRVRTSSRQENHPVSEKAVEAGALTAIKHLLEVDLHRVTCQEREAAEAALRAHPSTSELISAVKHWATALAVVCRSHARECARVHTNCGEKDPTTLAMGTILLTLSDHLGLPTDGTLLFENWPAQNDVREFMLEVSGAPVELIDGDIVRTPTVPRWEPKSSFARRIAGLEPKLSQGSDPNFLSVDETEHLLSGLAESFRESLLAGIETSFSEAVLEIQNHSTQQAEKSRTPEKGPDSMLQFGTKESLGLERAMRVEKIRREIGEIFQALELQEDYDVRIRGNEAFANFITVSVCNLHGDLCDKICAIKTTKKPKIVEIACEIAARARDSAKPTLPKTFYDAHKRYGKIARELTDKRQ